ncbi:MAG TPA: TorF family putative porin [Casimicrobiaceae bacterium]|nr:TorF family putative porin [Casimicrobiaceae bacterium]
MCLRFGPRSCFAFVAFASIGGAAIGQAPATAPAARDYTLAANVGLFSEYIFRGIAQTGGKPAVQGGFDYTHASGFYLGTWGSNISWLSDFGLYSHGSLEWDLYGGYKANFPGSNDWSYDAGTLYYYYPGSRNPNVVDVDTWEVYGAIGWKWMSAKASYTVATDYFGIRPSGQKTDGTWYLDWSATYPVSDTGFALVGHYGHLDVRHDGSGDSKASYDDWKLGASYTVPEGVFKAIEIGAYYTGNNAKAAFYTDPGRYNTAKDRGVVYVKKTF